ncbi:5-(carboxyamino)imidazole ribonucleotide synthase [Symbiobacterium thermophilum]|uniref:N5-carboxyaminoimidazole ribonucleotide synthase n=1 Tax=Symbiobacterium thermophilum (strain DSM 24528 / JCM 14929 / IAM 14863 / T) TaxID=292459 RepID=Q67NF1_SYMTH|nr:5-(carboxyamino)imidazole ribonucleotide synthase [Symbiobacterium thermophilum]BAD40792.1 phosphoribosylaminoimidazole carboxylase II [Symbiobacterium thermophilum IAM 14863]
MIRPGEVVGIVGGGQLARMSALAARAMGYRVAVADPDPDCPAAPVADRVIVGALNDPEALAPLADVASVITYEFENIDGAVLDRLAARRPVHPRVEILRTCQNRISEKQALERLGIPVAPWRPVRSADEIPAALEAVGLPAVLKTATMGYDGKGQAVIRTTAEAERALEALGGGPLVLERLVDFACELSVVVARSASGHVAPFPVAENIHARNILAYSIVPARVDPAVQAAARDLAVRIAEGLGLVGLLGVEMFCLPDGRLLVNELAPRPHNSGHYTQDACATSQFEQHIRAVCDLPLGAVDLLSPVCMVNVMGEDFPLDVGAALSDPHVKLHLYGKREPRPHRKMGHLNVLAPTADEALERAREAKAAIAGTAGQPRQA